MCAVTYGVFAAWPVQAPLPSAAAVHTPQGRSDTARPPGLPPAEAAPLPGAAPEKMPDSADSFSLLDEMEALDAIDIITINKLDLQRHSQIYQFDVTLVFRNDNPFPVLIKECVLDSTLALREDLQLRLGTIRLANVRLEASAEQPFGTPVDVLVEHGADLDKMRGILHHNFAPSGDGTVTVPLLVEGQLAVRIPLLGGLAIDRIVNIAFEYQPGMEAELMQGFRNAVQAAWHDRPHKGS